MNTLIDYVKYNTNRYAVDCKEHSEQKQSLNEKHRNLQKPFHRQRYAGLIYSRWCSKNFRTTWILHLINIKTKNIYSKAKVTCIFLFKIYTVLKTVQFKTIAYVGYNLAKVKMTSKWIPWLITRKRISINMQLIAMNNQNNNNYWKRNIAIFRSRSIVKEKPVWYTASDAQKLSWPNGAYTW